MHEVTVSQVRTILNFWNTHNPQRYIPWEWVEEMLLARARWHALARQRSGKALDYFDRYVEFKKKLPRSLVGQLVQSR